MRAPALLLVAAALLAGCAAPAPFAPPAPGPEVRDASGTWAILPTGFEGGEPSIGLTSSGAIFVAGAFPDAQPPAQESLGSRLMRSTDGGATWELVGDVVMDPRMNWDPWMWVDPGTDRVFNAPLGPWCTQLAWSDDEGATWRANPAVACGPPSHDHQKLVTGPPAAGTTMLGYPNVVYYGYNSLLVTGTTGVLGIPVPADQRLGTFVAVSLDGGQTFGPGQNIHASGCHRGIIGPPAVAPDGRVYIPHGTCDGVDVMVSADSGQTWATTSINALGSLDDFAFDPGVAVDSAGTAYLVWPAADALLYLATSTDGGATWSAPRRITPEGVNVTVYSSIVAGAAGKVAIAYAGTNQDPSGWEQRASSFANNDTVWDLYVTVVDQGQLTTHRLTTPGDPLQRGCIWMRGGANDCRNLLDFVTIVQQGGKLYLAYTDGCDACPAGRQSGASSIVVAVSPDTPLS